ncbi:MAG: N-acetylmuramoyl-L-alanine amidase [Rickettsiales bacterium]|jgi:N-acetylmuramoyl-L-alanine amidase
MNIIFQKFIRFFIFLAFLYSFPSFASNQITSIVLLEGKKSVNIIIYSKQKPDFKSFSISGPERLVMDFNDSKNYSNFKLDKSKFFTSFRSSESKFSSRFVFDAKKKIRIFHTVSEEIQLSMSDKYYRTIIKVINESGKSEAKKTKPVIVIDAGHGGKDPGAIGRTRVKEKDITLAYALDLKKYLDSQKKYKVYLTRSSDKFIPLAKRVGIARKKDADLFISLHANASKKKDIEGFSIYTLSNKSSDKEAEKLAQKENKADIIGGINLKSASGDILDILIDLAQRHTMNSSSIFAQELIKVMKSRGVHILQNTHRFAGFKVLTAPDMASVLIEIGYLTNKAEEKRMKTDFYKRKISKAITRGVELYFEKSYE